MKSPENKDLLEYIKKSAANINMPNTAKPAVKQTKINPVQPNRDALLKGFSDKLAESACHSKHKQLSQAAKRTGSIMASLKKESADIVSGGKSDGQPDSKYNKKQIQMGIGIEKEHTGSAALAKEIAKDHLEEFPDYYTRLKKMEHEAESAKEKKASVLTAKARKHISKKNFAIPEEKAYPIEDKVHARNALARVSQFGDSSEKSRVRAAVKSKYPGIEQEKKAAHNESGEPKEEEKKEEMAEEEEAGASSLSEDQKSKIKNFLKGKSNIRDYDFHEFVEDLGANIHKAEAYVYSLAKGSLSKQATLNGFINKIARDMPSFTRQHRPAKVKEIYKALKRDHPNMPAEEKARIASRQGKPGKQKQGPPYKAPLSKSASNLTDKTRDEEDQPRHPFAGGMLAGSAITAPIAGAVGKRYGFRQGAQAAINIVNKKLKDANFRKMLMDSLKKL